MTLPSTRFCPKCHASVEAGVRYCLNCGSPVDPEPEKVIGATSYNAQPSYETYAPPPVSNYLTPDMQVSSSYGPNIPGAQTSVPPNAAWQAPQSFPYGNAPAAQTPPTYMPNDMASVQATPLPPPTMPHGPYPTYNPTPGPAPAKARSSKRLYAIIAVSVIVVLVAVVGIYALFNHGAVPIVGTASGPAASEQLNLTTVYASDQITFTSVQQAANYPDDKNAFQTTANIIRISMKEAQLSKHGSYFSYMENFHLILPDKSVISPTLTQSFSAPQTDVTRTNWVDFAVNAKYDLTGLVLRLGASDEAQILVPLQPNANLSKYQPKTTSQNKTVSYSGLNWALLSATQSLSADGQQAKTGQVYVTVTLSASNPGAEDFFGYDYLRLKTGSMEIEQSTESSLNMPDVIKSNAANVNMTATFLVTVSATNSYTLVFIADQQGNAEADVDFSI